MGLKTNHEAIRGVRSGKGVIDGCTLSKTAANTITVAAGRVKLGMTADDYTANGGQFLNEGGAELAFAGDTFDTSSLDLDEAFLLYLKTNGTLSVTPDARTQLADGPLVSLNNVGASNINAEALDTPSVRLGSFVRSSALATQATGTVTIGGTAETGNVVTVVIGGVSVAFTVTGAETTTALVAEAVKEAINDDEDAAALVTATRSNSIITLTAVEPGTGGNAITLTTAVTGDTPTTTSTASGAVLSGAIAGAIDKIDHTRRETL